eukprot:TRINITY_DN13931_c0_g1_i1.p2 TRINITY_DN13931_c0_g1~~TRINITY_DN13931_c0_g1_i1.p2  ORF type:complete len:268 (+),score=47.01 TRINITY_DN13931_c0_g1_i1:103-906(+)
MSGGTPDLFKPQGSAKVAPAPDDDTDAGEEAGEKKSQGQPEPSKVGQSMLASDGDPTGVEEAGIQQPTPLLSRVKSVLAVKTALGPPLSVGERFAISRLVLIAMFCVNAVFACINAVGHNEISLIPTILQAGKATNLLVKIQEGRLQEIRDAINAPSESVVSTNSEHTALAALFGLAAAVQGLFILVVVLRRHHIVRPPAAKNPLEQLLFPRKGSARYWLKVNLVSPLGSLLQLLRLLAYGGYDLGSQGEIPAVADEIVKTSPTWST